MLVNKAWDILNPQQPEYDPKEANKFFMSLKEAPQKFAEWIRNLDEKWTMLKRSREDEKLRINT